MCFFILYNVEKERGESTGDEEGAPTAYYKYVEVFTMKYMMPYTLPIAERGEGIRDEERRPTAYYCYAEAFSMKYMMPYTRSERVWINCAATLTAISAGVSLPISIPMGVITRASCCSL